MHVLVVGSSVIDLFLTLDSEHVEIADKKVLLTLGDKVPTDIKRLMLGGNGSNAAVGLTRLEVPTSFYTYLGGDALSQEIESGLTREGVALLSQKDNGNTSMSIILDFSTDRIILSHHEKRVHKFNLTQSSGFDYIYLHSIGEPWEEAYRQVLDYSRNNNIPIAFSPGSHQIESANNEVIFEVIKNTKIFFSNKEEAAKITNSQDPTQIQDLLISIKNLGPKIVSITDGAEGAYAIDESDNVYFIKPSPTKAVEKAGAGDAYASAFFASILHGNDVPTAMHWGVLNAEGVMMQVGAQTGLLSKKMLDEHLTAGDNLHAERI